MLRVNKEDDNCECHQTPLGFLMLTDIMNAEKQEKEASQILSLYN